MIVGIDLGTTNSLIGVWRNGEPRLIPNALGELLTPSAVSVLDTGERGGPKRPATGWSAIRAAPPPPSSGSWAPTAPSPWASVSSALRKPVGSGAAVAQGRCRGMAGRARARGGDHRAGVFRRFPAQGDAGGGRTGRSSLRAPAQRADRRRARLRSARTGREPHSGGRSWRRHLRRSRSWRCSRG